MRCGVIILFAFAAISTTLARPMQDIGELQHDKTTESIKDFHVLTPSPVLHEGVAKREHTSIGTFETGTQALSPGVAGLLPEEKGPTSVKSPLWRLVKRGKGRKAKEKMVGTSSGEDLDAEVGSAILADARANQESILASPEAQEHQRKMLSDFHEHEKEEEARQSQQLTRELYQQFAPEIHAWEQAQPGQSSSHTAGLTDRLEGMSLEQVKMLSQDPRQKVNDLSRRVRLPEVGHNYGDHSSTGLVIHLPPPPHNSPHSPTRVPKSLSSDATQPRKRSTEEVHTPWQLVKRGKTRDASDYHRIEGMDELSNEIVAGLMQCLQDRALGTLRAPQQEHEIVNKELSDSKEKLLAAFDRYTPRTEVGRVFKKKVRELLEQHPSQRVKKIIQKVKSHEDSQRPEIREAIDECDRLLDWLIANSDQGTHYRGSSSSGSALSLPAQSAESATMLPNSISNFITRPRKRSTEEEARPSWRLVKRGNAASRNSQKDEEAGSSFEEARKSEEEARKLDWIKKRIEDLDVIGKTVLARADLELKNYASAIADDSQQEHEDVNEKSRKSKENFQKALESFEPLNALELQFKAWFCQNFKKYPPHQAQFALTQIKEEVEGEATDVHAALEEYGTFLKSLRSSGKTHDRKSHGSSSSGPKVHLIAPSAHSRRMPLKSTPSGSTHLGGTASARMPRNAFPDNTGLQKRSKEPAGDDLPDLKEARIIDRLFQHADTCENVCRDVFEALKVIIPAKAVRGALMNQPSESPLEASTSTTSRITKASLPQPASQQNERPDERPFEAQARSRRGSRFGKRTTVPARESCSSTDERQHLQHGNLLRPSSSRQELVEGIRKMSLTGAQESDTPPEQRELSIEQKTAERCCEYQLRECFLRIAYNISDMPGRRTLSADDAAQNLQVDLGIRAEDNDASLPYDEELLVQKFRNDRRNTSNLVRKATIDRVITHIYERNGVFKPNDWHELEDPASSSSSRRTSSHMASLPIQKEHEWPKVYQKMAENEEAKERRQREEEQNQHEDADNDSVDRRNQPQALSVMSGALVKATKAKSGVKNDAQALKNGAEKLVLERSEKQKHSKKTSRKPRKSQCSSTSLKPLTKSDRGA